MGPVILGHPLASCDGFYPRTRDGRCSGCGTWSIDEIAHRMTHREAYDPSKAPKAPKARRSDAEVFVAALVAKAGGSVTLSSFEIIDAIGFDLEEVQHPDGSRTYKTRKQP